MTAEQITLPAWLKPASKVNKLLLRMGVRIGTQHILEVIGRKSGKPRSTPVSLLTVGGQRYVVSLPTLEWVKNARARPSARLSRGGRTERVRLVEVDGAERREAVGAFPRQIPHGVQFLRLPADPDEAIAIADRYVAFRVAREVG